MSPEKEFALEWLKKAKHDLLSAKAIYSMVSCKLGEQSE
jgi:hypothetical protein